MLLDRLPPFRKFRKKHAFTLIEVLVAMGIVGVLAGVTIQAIAPRKNTAAAWDARRYHNAKQQENALYQYLIDFQQLPNEAGIPEGEESAKWICMRGVVDASCANLDPMLVPEYLASLPEDDVHPCALHTGYKVWKSVGRPRVFSPYLGKLPGDTIPDVPCTAQPINFIATLDNGDPGFTAHSPYQNFNPWQACPGSEGYKDDCLVWLSTASVSSGSASWVLSVTPGQDYNLYATWVGVYNAQGSVQFRIYDGPTLDLTTNIDQNVTPNDYQYDDALWESLGQYHADTSTLKFVLYSNNIVPAGSFAIPVADGVAVKTP